VKFGAKVPSNMSTCTQSAPAACKNWGKGRIVSQMSISMAIQSHLSLCIRQHAKV
jgi:hypothetical protein